MSSYRYMRLFVIFDLPRYTSNQQKQANAFRKKLVDEGFLMLQESVYCKLALNDSVMQAIKQRVREIKPSEGDVMMFGVTEKQFEDIEFLLNPSVSNVVDNTDRLVIL